MSTDWLGDIATGAVSSGVNFATFAALNVALLLVIVSLVFLLACSLTSPAHAWATPHVLVLIFLAITLWGLMIWLIGVVGITETTAQEPLSFEQQQQGQGLAGQEEYEQLLDPATAAAGEIQLVARLKKQE